MFQIAKPNVNLEVEIVYWIGHYDQSFLSNYFDGQITFFMLFFQIQCKQSKL
jgi:hypothetical protein